MMMKLKNFPLIVRTGMMVFFVIAAFNGFAADKPEIFVQLGHQGVVSAAAFSPDGKYLATASTDQTVKLWDVATGSEIRTFPGPSAEINAVAVASGGRLVVSGDKKGVIKLWDATNGRILFETALIGKEPDVRNLSFSPDGRFFSSVSMGGVLTVWDVASGQPVKTIEKLTAYAFMSSGEVFIAAEAAYKQYTLLKLPSGTEAGTFRNEKTFIDGISFSADGRHALLMNKEYQTGKIVYELFNLREQKRIVSWSMNEGKGFHKVVLSPDGRKALSVGTGGMILWDAMTGRVLKTLTSDLTSFASFSPDGRFLISAGLYAPTLWEVSTGNVVRGFVRRPLGTGNAAAISPDGRYITVSSVNSPPLIWDIAGGKPAKILEGYSNARAFLAGGRYVLLGTPGKTFDIWDIAANKPLRKLQGAYVSSSQDGSHVAELLPDGQQLNVREAATGKEVIRYREPAGKIKAFGIAANNRHLLTIVDNSARLVDLATGTEEKFSWPEPYFINAVISPAGKFIAVFVMNKEFKNVLRIYDAGAKREIRSIEGAVPAASAAFSPDDARILFSIDKKLILCDTATGAVVKTFSGHTDTVWFLNFCQGGERIVSAGVDRSIRVWDTATGNELMTLAGHSGAVRSVYTLPDEKHILSIADDNTTRIWDITTGKEQARLFSFTDGEWIAITPEGYFNASPGGAKYLNVRVGNQIYSIDNFYERFFNPVYVVNVLQGRQAEVTADIRQGVLQPPEVRITSPSPGSVFSADTLTVKVAARDTGGGIDEIRLYHNGKALGGDQRAVKVVSRGDETIREYVVLLVDGVNTFRAVGFSKDRTESNPAELIIKLAAPSREVSLHVISVGINRYKNPALNLNYAEPDAKGIAEFFRKQSGGLFKKVDIREIYNEQATRDHILMQLKGLQNTSPQDAVLIYLAGHGESLNDKWYFIPHELTYPEREEDVKTRGISSDELSGWIKNIRAQKVLLLVDACKSGAVLVAFRGFEDRKALSQLSRSTGVHVVAASTKDQFAAEVKDLGHGVFTYTLLEGLKGKAARPGESVTVRKLMGYVEEQLPEITKKYKQEAQYPVVDSRGMDFPLVIAK